MLTTLVGYAVFLAVNSDVSPTVANTFNYAAPVVALLLSAGLLASACRCQPPRGRHCAARRGAHGARFGRLAQKKF